MSRGANQASGGWSSSRTSGSGAGPEREDLTVVGTSREANQDQVGGSRSAIRVGGGGAWPDRGPPDVVGESGRERELEWEDGAR
jgi:hypothetical protein